MSPHRRLRVIAATARMDLLESQSYTADEEAAHMRASMQVMARRGPKRAAAITEFHVARGISIELPDDPSAFRSIVIRDDAGSFSTGPRGFDLDWAENDIRIPFYLPILIRDPYCPALLVAYYATMVELIGHGIEIRCHLRAAGKWCEWAALTSDEALLHARFEIYADEMPALWCKYKYELVPVWCYTKPGPRLCIAILNIERQWRLPLDLVWQQRQLQLPFPDGTP